MLKRLHEWVRTSFILIVIVSLCYGVAWAGLNRIVGPTVTPGWGIIADGDSTEFNATQAWTDSLWEMVYEMIDSTTAPIPIADSADLITHDRIRDWHFGDDDWGDLSVSSNAVTLDNDVVGTDEMADADHGDFTYSGGSATLDAGVVADNEIDYSAVTLDDFDYQTAYRIFYSNADGDVTELALGADGQYLKSNGAGSVPSWATPSGSGTQDTTWIWNDAGDEAHAGLNSAVHLKWGNGIDATWNADDTVVTASVDEGELTLSSMGGAVTDGQVPNDITIDEASDVDTTGTKIAAALGNRIGAGVITDSIWSSKPIFGAQYAHLVTLEDSIATYRFAAEGTYFSFNLLYNFSEAANDQIDSTWFKWIMPSESPDLDSFVIPAYYTSADDVDSAGMTVHLFKKTEPLGDTTRIYNGSALKTSSAWTHLAIAGGSIDAISGGDQLIALIVSKADPIDTVKFEDPVPYSPQT